MADRSSPGVREALARFALELEGIDYRFAQHEPQRSDARPAADVSIDDWDALLEAVKARLGQAVEGATTAPLNGAAAPFRTMVLECVDALGYLQAALRDQRTRDEPNAAADAAVTAGAGVVEAREAGQEDGSAAPSAAPATAAATPPRTPPA